MVTWPNTWSGSKKSIPRRQEKIRSEPPASRAWPRAGVRLGLPASARARGRRQKGQGRLRRRDARLHYKGKTRSRDKPPARLLHPSRGHKDGASATLWRGLVLRVEGQGPLL